MQLKYLLDQGLPTSIDDLSRSPNGNIDDQLRLTRDRVGIVKTPNGDLDVTLDLVTRPGEPAIWLFSQQTLNAVPAAYASVHHTDYEHFFPAWTHVHLFSLPLWRWAIILICIALTFGIATLLTRATLWLLRGLFRKKMSVSIENVALTLKAPVFFLMLALIDRVAGGYAITALGRGYWRTIALVIAWISGAWLLMRVTDIFIHVARYHLLMQSQMERITFVSLLGRVQNLNRNRPSLCPAYPRRNQCIRPARRPRNRRHRPGSRRPKVSSRSVRRPLHRDARRRTRRRPLPDRQHLRNHRRHRNQRPDSTNPRPFTRIDPELKSRGSRSGKLLAPRSIFVTPVVHAQSGHTHDTLKKLLKQINHLLTPHPGSNGATARARLIDLTPTGPQIEVYAYFQKSDTDWESLLSQREELILKIISAIEAAGTSLASPIGVMQIDQPPANTHSTTTKPPTP